MRFWHCIFVLVCSVLLQSYPNLYAQMSTGPSLQRAALEFEGVGTLANGSWTGQTFDRHLFLLGISYRRLLTQRRGFALKLSARAIPLGILREPFINGCGFDPVSGRCVALQASRSFPPFTYTGTSYGIGASPLGLQISFLPSHRIQPYFGIQGGFLYFNRNVLNVSGARFNFTIDGRTGVSLSLDKGKAISFGYLFHHMSNHDIAASNPGMDSHMVNVAYSFPFHWLKR